MANPEMHLGERKKLVNGMEGHGGPWGFRVIIVLELVRLCVDAPDEEEISEDEDEDHPQWAYLPPSGPCRSSK
jgi:hypothetical protein